MTGPDVRAFYGALGLDLPGWTQHNATVRCFADPAAHAHEDRTPSCSVSLDHGAWHCFACGARGGAYDAAIARGHSSASAIDLMVRHGLTERRASDGYQVRRPRLPHPQLAGASAPPQRAVLEATDADVLRWHSVLFSPRQRRRLEALSRTRLWHPAAMRALQLGYDRGRITIPIRDEADRLIGVLRYRPGAANTKMLAVPGTRLGLIPHPVRETSRSLLLVEGPPDMIAARSLECPAIAVPGNQAWREEWAPLFRDRFVTVVMDCDQPGRNAAERIAADLKHVCQVRLVDLAPGRTDGFDLTDAMRTHPYTRSPLCKPSSSSKQTITP